MKMAISFICGVVICFLILYGVKPVLPAFAETATYEDESEIVTLEDALKELNELTESLPEEIRPLLKPVYVV